MANANNRSQIPLGAPIIGQNGLVTQQWAFWFKNLFGNLPPGGAGYVIDGSAGSTGPTTMYQGAAINRGSSPADNSIYFANDTGQIFVSSGGAWLEQSPEYVGDVLKAAHSNQLTLATVNSNVGTFGDALNIPTFTVNNKGLITAAGSIPLNITPSAAGTTGSVQININGQISAANGFQYDFDPDVQSLGVPNIHIGTYVDNADVVHDGQITFENPVPTMDNLSPNTTKGDLLGHDGTHNVRVPVGTDGQALVSDSTADTGVSYKDIVNSVEITSTDLTVTASGTTGDVTIDLVLNTVPIDKGGTGQITKEAAFDALSPLTDDWDLLTYKTGTNIRLATGAPGEVLTVSSDPDVGYIWTTPGGGSGTPGGLDTEMQFNDAGSFGGAPSVSYDKVNNIFGVQESTFVQDTPNVVWAGNDFVQDDSIPSVGLIAKGGNMDYFVEDLGFTYTSTGASIELKPGSINTGVSENFAEAPGLIISGGAFTDTTGNPGTTGVGPTITLGEYDPSAGGPFGDILIETGKSTDTLNYSGNIQVRTADGINSGTFLAQVGAGSTTGITGDLYFATTGGGGTGGNITFESGPNLALDNKINFSTGDHLISFNRDGSLAIDGDVGTAGQVLTSAGAGLISWAAGGGGSSPLTTKGDLYGFDTAPARIPVGTDGYVLTADSVDPTGVSWQPGSGGAPVSVVNANGFDGTVVANAITLTTTVTGIVKGDGTALSAASAGDFPTLNQDTTGTADNVTGVVAIANGGTGETTANAAFNALSPATTKGDLIGFSTIAERIPVGYPGYSLQVDLGESTGLTYYASGMVSDLVNSDEMRIIPNRRQHITYGLLEIIGSVINNGTICIL